MLRKDFVTDVRSVITHSSGSRLAVIKYMHQEAGIPLSLPEIKNVVDTAWNAKDVANSIYSQVSEQVKNATPGQQTKVEVVEFHKCECYFSGRMSFPESISCISLQENCCKHVSHRVTTTKVVEYFDKQIVNN